MVSCARGTGCPRSAHWQPQGSVSRGTVVAAYADLAERGPRRPAAGERAPASPGQPQLPCPAQRQGEERPCSPLALPNAIDLLRTVPQISDLGVQLIRDHKPRLDLALLPETDPAGLPALRALIADMYTAEGTPTTPEQILVTTRRAAGHQPRGECRLVGPGDIVLAEEITWPGVTDSVGLRGGTVHGVPMGDDGLDVDALEQALARLRPVLVALNPHHQNPPGRACLPPRGTGVPSSPRSTAFPSSKTACSRVSPSTGSCRPRSRPSARMPPSS